jgi:hypothetical protein
VSHTSFVACHGCSPRLRCTVASLVVPSRTVTPSNKSSCSPGMWEAWAVTCWLCCSQG